jgi:hypothetical protein
MRASDDFPLAHNNRADRHFAGYVRFLRLPQCFAYEIFVRQRFEHP